MNKFVSDTKLNAFLVDIDSKMRELVNTDEKFCKNGYSHEDGCSHFKTLADEFYYIIFKLFNTLKGVEYPRNPEVKVKQLEWEETVDEPRDAESACKYGNTQWYTYTAECGLLSYIIEEDAGETEFTATLHDYSGSSIIDEVGVFEIDDMEDTVLKAKEACQKHYEKLVLSAIED